MTKKQIDEMFPHREGDKYAEEVRWSTNDLNFYVRNALKNALTKIGHDFAYNGKAPDGDDLLEEHV